MEKLAIRTNNGRDLYADLQCDCPDERYKHKPSLSHLFKTKHLLCGYNDSNFFVNVNKAPKEHVCKCGRKRMIQWTPEGVLVEDAP